MLSEAESKVQELSRESERLSKAIDGNEDKIAGIEEDLHIKMGDLEELFGVIRQISGELNADLAQSMISVHFPQRSDFLQQLSERKALPDIPDLQKMWLIMLEELDESRKTTRFTAPVVQIDGSTRGQEVIRIGTYAAVSKACF